MAGRRLGFSAAVLLAWSHGAALRMAPWLSGIRHGLLPHPDPGLRPHRRGGVDCAHGMEAAYSPTSCSGDAPANPSCIHTGMGLFLHGIWDKAAEDQGDCRLDETLGIGVGHAVARQGLLDPKRVRTPEFWRDFPQVRIAKGGALFGPVRQDQFSVGGERQGFSASGLGKVVRVQHPGT